MSRAPAFSARFLTERVQKRSENGEEGVTG